MGLLRASGTARDLLVGDAEAREEQYMAGGPYTGPLTLLKRGLLRFLRQPPRVRPTRTSRPASSTRFQSTWRTTSTSAPSTASRTARPTRRLSALSKDAAKAVSAIAGDPARFRTVELKLNGYYDHLLSVIQPCTSVEEALAECKRRFKNIPDRHFASVDQLVRSAFRQKPSSTSPSTAMTET
jgi:hypothetical protein